MITKRIKGTNIELTDSIHQAIDKLITAIDKEKATMQRKNIIGQGMRSGRSLLRISSDTVAGELRNP